MRNPFFHRQAVSDPSQFFGRAPLVRELFEMIASRQSCAIIGERRIGKSTLLSYLASPPVQIAHGLDSDLVLFGSLDFLALGGLAPDELWREMLEALAHDAVEGDVRAKLEAAADAETLTFSTFRRTLKRLGRRGYRVVLLCDELDLAVDNPQLDESFFGALRSLAGEGVAFVTASRASLLELEQYRSEEARRKVLASPFFNIFAEFSLGVFEDHEVAEWLAASLETTPIRFDALDVRWLDAQAGRHPFFLQLAAYHLFGELERRGLARVVHPRPEESGKASGRAAERERCRAAAAERIRLEAAKIFRYQWRHSRPDERSQLAAIVRAGSNWRQGWRPRGGRRGDGRRDDPPRTVGRLVRRGLLRREKDNGSASFHCFSKPFFDWLRTEASLATGDSGEMPALPRALAGSPTARTADSPAAWSADSLAVARHPQRFELLEELGHGGTATVFKAWDQQLERLVALKLLDEELKAEDQGRRLLEEARACARLRHPNIVVIFDIDAEAGVLVEEFMPGGSLRDLLAQGPAWRPEELLILAAQLAAALEAAHDAGIVHADVKPENVLLAERAQLHDSAAGRRLPRVKLTDFGAAHRSTGHMRGNGGSGTLAYMAPEQLGGRGLTPAADVFSFGVLLWEARYGERPEDGVTQLAPRPDELDRLLFACLAPDPAARLSGGGALRAAVEELASTG